ncbi:MAG: hypothetical protein HFG15_00500 [Bacilli bacterium]|nr:hypothetical protein [Bacilli bacterium]
MKESFWAVIIVMIGVISILFVNFFQNLTNTDEHNYNLLKETTEAAMYDAFDIASYRADGVVRIDREKFVENFLRRFAASANLSRTYRIDIYDVNETPPKVSLKVSSSEGSSITGTKDGVIEFEISNRLDAILEVPY